MYYTAIGLDCGSDFHWGWPSQGSALAVVEGFAAFVRKGSTQPNCTKGCAKTPCVAALAHRRKAAEAQPQTRASAAKAVPAWDWRGCAYWGDPAMLTQLQCRAIEQLMSLVDYSQLAF